MKIKVAILDNDATFGECLRDKVIFLAQKQELNVSISTFQNPIELEKSRLLFDLLFLETAFEGAESDGIAWVKRQMPLGRYKYLIYVSAWGWEVFRAIETAPIAFVRKYRLDDDLKKAIGIFKEKLHAWPNFVAIQEGTKRHFCIPEELLYLNSKGHYVDIVHRSGEKNVIRGKLNDIEHALREYGFLRVHISYLINVRYISKIDRCKLYMSDGRIFNISMKYKEQVYKKLNIYETE